MASSIVLKHRNPGQTAGAPASLKSGEIAYNMTDGFFYIGFGDDGSGGATSIKMFAKDDFNVMQRIPTGGTTGQYLVKSSGSDYAVTWQAASSYVAGNGITVTGLTVAIDPAIVALLASPAFTGVPTAPTAAPGTNTTQIATTGFVTNLGAGKSNVGHTHAASDITTGVFDIARIPVLPGNTTIVASSNIASLTTGQQASIDIGTIVTTTDGRRWVYSTGTKTQEASYVEMADVTPEWTVIANKPNFHAVAVSGSYNDLTNKPTLGTLASQNAATVAITGGSITGVTIANAVIDGGTF